MTHELQWPGWEIGPTLGKGGFGKVVEIHRQIPGSIEKAALKIISIPGSEDEIIQMRADGFDDATITDHFREQKEDILREYVMMAQMRGCAHIVYCEDFRAIQHDNGFGWDIYIKMELLTPLMKHLDGTVTEAQVRRLGMDLCNALSYCCHQNIIHRDIKPANIFAAPDGSFKLGDFGIARTLERTSGATRIGTEGYMAPEIYRGHPYGSRADIYSLGLVLYELMNGFRRPFEPSHDQPLTLRIREEARFRRFRGETLPPPAYGSPALQQIVLKACAFDPAQRYASPEEMLQDLKALESGRPVAPAPRTAPPPVHPPRTASPARKEGKPSRSRSILPFVGVICMCLIFAMLLTGLFARKFFGLGYEDPTNLPAVEIPEDIPNHGLAGEYDITVWVPPSIVALTNSQIDRFNQTNDQGITINAIVEGIDAIDAGSYMAADPYAGADLYCYKQEHTGQLVEAGALQPLDESAARLIMDSQDALSIASVTHDNVLYAYPMASDNGFFMYYDKTVISESQATSMEAIIAACEASGRNFSFDLSNGWYASSFFFATGCVTEWEYAEDMNYTCLADTFNSEQGVIAATGMRKLLTSSCFHNSSMASDLYPAGNSAVVISGYWDYSTARSLLGENLVVAPLPSFEVNGSSYHLTCFAGCSLLGVKPQTDPNRREVLNLLAQYLTNDEAQSDRFLYAEWVPSSLHVQSSPAVQAHPWAAAMVAQNRYSLPQRLIHGGWWDIVKYVAPSIQNGQDIRSVLAEYEKAINALNPSGIQGS